MNTHPPIYRDRRHAGQVLAGYLPAYKRQPHCLVLGLARGGVPVAYEIAAALDLPLDVMVVRKLNVPGSNGTAMGAIASGGARVLNAAVVGSLHDSDQILAVVTRREQAILQRSEEMYRTGRGASSPRHRTVLLVDDHLNTGTTMQAAVRSLHLNGAERCVVVVPAAAPDSTLIFEALTDDIVCPPTSPGLHHEEDFYADYPETTDEEVRDLLEHAARRFA